MKRADLVDAPERRSVPVGQFDFRSTGSSTLKLSGYASVFGKGYDVHGGPDGGGWTEYVTRGAFDRTLSEKPHVHLLINHEGLPLASTKSGTLRLSADSQGLLSEAELDRRDPDVAGLAVKMERGDVDEMSFAFRVKAQRWGDGDETRHLDEVSLHKGDVSIVNWGANPHTSAALRSAIQMLSGKLDDRQLAELRAMPGDVKRAVAAVLVGAHRKKRRSLSPISDYSDAIDGGDVFDQGEPRDSTLAQAIHDMCADEDGVACDPTNLPADTPMYEPGSGERNLTLAEAAMLAGAVPNLTVRQVEKICGYRSPRRARG